MVCASDDTTAPDSLVLQVIKVLLTAVASPTFQVRGECFLTAIRTCYNIVLNSKNPVNQATARATLTQMINIVLRRMESDIEAGKIVSSPSAQAPDDAHASSSNDEDPVTSSNENVPHEDDGQSAAEPALVYSRTTTIHIDPETGEARNASTGETMEMSIRSLRPLPSTPPPVLIAEFQHLATESNLKGIEAALDQAVTPEGAIKNLDGKDLDLLTLGQKDALLVLRTISKMAMKDGSDDLLNRTKLLSLELLQGCLESVSHAFTTNFAFIELVKAYICYALLRSCVSPTAAVFQLAVNIFFIMMQRYRTSLKAELGILFNLIVLRSLDIDCPLHQKSAVLKMVGKACDDPQMLTDIFVNYDCDLEATNLFERMVNSLSRLAQATVSGDLNAANASQSIALKASALQCLVSVLRSLGTWTSKQRGNRPVFPDLSVAEVEVDGDGMNGDGSDVEVKDDTKSVTQGDEFEKAKALKVSLESGIAKFNVKPSSGMKFLFEHNLVAKEPKAVAQFLRESPGLDKTMIGDYLGQHDEFSMAVMHSYVDALDLSGMKFDKAIRIFLNGFRLPGEAQKIDRIMEKFAESYCRDNPSLFKNADTAYVLAYAVIMLSTDAHNPMVTKKMTKSAFVRMNSSSDVDEHAALELLEEIYDSIVGEEIKLKDEDSKRERREKRRSLVSILNLGGFRGRNAADAKKESDEIIDVTQTIFKKVRFKKGVFHKAEHEDLARPMLDAVGWPLLAAFSVTMEDSDSKSGVLLCMEGVRLGIHLTKALGMETMRYAFLTSLVRSTFLHAPMEMRSKNVEALKTLLTMCQNEPEALQDTWNAVLECVSRLEFIVTTSGIASTLMQGSNQISRDSLMLSLTELTGKATEQVFVNSVQLPSDAIVEFFAALCSVSAEELRQSPPRVFSLTKLVEISSSNMTRIRMVWARIWAVLSVHFAAAGSHSDEKIAMYTIDSLRQLAVKYLERVELANFTFQNDILRPFVMIMRNSKNPTIRALIVDCMVQMIKSKVGSIKSGWRSVFMFFSLTAYDSVVSIANIAFEHVEQVVLEHFDQVVGDCFMDCVHCLVAFANNRISSQTSLKAIALLRICEDRLADGQIGGGVWNLGGSEDQPYLEASEYYLFPMLAGLSGLTSDPRIEVRSCALEVLFDLLKERGKNFSGAFWEIVFHRVLFPIFDYVRYANKDGEKPASVDQWLRETCIHSLQLLCDLFSSFYKEVSFLLPALLGLLLDCGTRPDQTLAAISMGAVVRLAEVGGHQFNDKDWTTLLDSIRDACYTTQPVELLNPESMLTFGSDNVSGQRALSIASPSSSMRGGYSSYGQSEGDRGHFDARDNGAVEGMPKSLSNCDSSKTNRAPSYDAVADDRLERLSIAESEGSEAAASVASPRVGKASGRSFMSNVMDTVLLKNTTFRSVRGKPADGGVHSSLQDVDMGEQGPDGSEVEGPLLQDVRTKCVIQLLLLGALDSLQRNHWQRLQPSHKRLVMDTLLSMVDFSASYNKDSNLRSRMQHVYGDRPPPNLLPQETEGTKIYLAVLNKIAAESVHEVRSHENVEQGNGDPEIGEISWKGGRQKLREEAERQLVSFCGHVLKEVAALQPVPDEAVQSGFHRVLDPRSAVTAEVLEAMRDMDTLLFKKLLPEFYPYFTKLICSDQMDVRKALGELFRVQLVALLP
ncbi:brefeldin A-inhibited guanine nucleotide-exchange protein 5 isoform X2 [Physcomitrium patens]|nr:brefeldin A-inhibited guanine nucleotide-exchange protein 5-like isoform X2 [Physcomitrium patens]|eukprot:XP_024402161.1 brefeldin A-inhibited guanine nucleotide-exchange protein 5-like isoform X2 [Physcomitrella patens]